MPASCARLTSSNERRMARFKLLPDATHATMASSMPQWPSPAAQSVSATGPSRASRMSAGGDLGRRARRAGSPHAGRAWRSPGWLAGAV